MRIGLFEIERMPTWYWMHKSGLNYNGVDIFSAIHIGYIEIRKYKSKKSLDLWKN